MNRNGITLIIFLILLVGGHGICHGQAECDTYLNGLKAELQKKWPDNRTINLVFHGHSVPSGYFATPHVRTLDAYPHQVLERLKEWYPYAVINVITTSFGGENSLQGEKRFESEVLNHKPDVLFIDYALNDRNIGLEKSREAMAKMVERALKENIKVILLTPSPDTRVDLTVEGNELEQFANMLVELAANWHVGLANAYGQFRKLAVNGADLNDYMAQVNHPNKKGHTVITETIMAYFK
jgi:hypothetical protein